MEFWAMIQALASGLALIASLIAVWIAYKAPERADRLHRDHEAQIELRRERHRILRILMKHRGRNLSADESVDAINMIVVAFDDQKLVKDALEDFLRFINGADNAKQRNEAYQRLIVEITKSLGYSDSITVASIDRGYFPLLNS